MKHHRTLTLGAVVMLLANSAFAGDTPAERKSLEGLPGVSISVIPLNAEEKKAGLTNENIQQIAELSLRKARIKILTEKEMLATDRMASLLVTVSIISAKGGTQYAYSIDISLKQMVTTLDADHSLAMASTWSTGMLGIATKNDTAPLKEYLQEQMDTFANAFLAANPDK